MRVRVKGHCSWYDESSGATYMGGTPFEMANESIKPEHTRQLEFVKPADTNRNTSGDVAFFRGLIQQWEDRENDEQKAYAASLRDGRDMVRINAGLRARVAQLERERELVGVGMDDDDPIGGQDRQETRGRKRA